jgi:hypothetical protein
MAMATFKSVRAGDLQSGFNRDQQATIRIHYICDQTPTVTRILLRFDQDPIASPSSGSSNPASCSGSRQPSISIQLGS